MVFSDLFFLFAFLPLFAVCYLAASLADRLKPGGDSSNAVKNAVLVAFSLVFYAWGEPMYVFLMLASVFVNYLAGLAVGGRHRKAALAAGLAANIAIIGVFKYLDFFALSLSALGAPLSPPGIALPIGISFYTFQSISYLVDVYRREAPPQRRYRDLLLYISMFPQLIAGPIVRYDMVAVQINQRRITVYDFTEGAYRFLIGLGKKVILANQFSEIAGGFLDGRLQGLSTAGAWVGIAAFTFQIFFDFSGYSDMAIGLGRCLGFHFGENFRHPYCCRSITEFWRRWHISLGSFFRDYVYIPMGGNRRHQAANILVVWFLTGMWHGASWNFILWGVYFGLIVTLEKHTILRWAGVIPRAALHAYSLFLVVAGWGIFYFTDFGRMVQFFTAFFGGGAAADITVQSALLDNFWLWAAAVLFSMPVYDTVAAWHRRLFPSDGAARRTVALAAKSSISVAILVLSAALLVGATNNAFIYTRF